MRILLFLLAGAALAVGITARAEETPAVSVSRDAASPLPIADRLEAYIEPADEMSITQVSGPGSRAPFRPLSSLGAQYPRKGAWLRLRVRNETLEEARRVLALDNPTALRADAYLVRSDFPGRAVPLLDTSRTGSDLIGFPFTLRAGETADVFVRMETNLLLEGDSTLFSEEAFRARDAAIQRLFNLYFGVFLALFLYNGMLYFSIRDRDYPFYLAFEGTAAVAFFLGSGMARVYLGHILPWTTLFVAPYLLSIVTAMLFARRFLRTRDLLPRADRALLAMAGAEIAAFVFSPLRLTPITGAVSTFINLFGAIFLIAMAAACWRQGHRSARYFLVSWSISLLSVFVWALAKVHVLPHNLFTFYAPIPGVLLEMIIIAFALANQISDAKLKLTEARGAALVEMAGGISHEINNPLTAVLLLAGHLRDWLNDHVDPEQREAPLKDVARVQSMAERIARIIQGLRAFARDASQDPFLPAGVQEIVSNSLLLCTELPKRRGIALEVQRIPPDAAIECRKLEIEQTLLGLIHNAVDAAARADSGRNRWIRLGVERRGAWIEISVTDSGPGVPPSIRDRIFQPFFTTKTSGHAVGLGLSMAKGIVESHGGKLFLDSASPDTRFVMRLPRARQAPSAPGPAQGADTHAPSPDPVTHPARS